jgi:hypothetical protein
MKISQLLAPVNEAINDTVTPTPNSPLGRAQAAAAAKANSMNPKVGGVPNLSTGLPQATTNPQPTTLGAPTAVKAQQAATTGQVTPATGQAAITPAAKSGINWGGVGTALKKGATVAGQGIVKGAQSVAQNAPAVGQGISNVAQGLGTAGTGLVKGAGDIASQAAGGITQAVGAAAGGLGAGYQTARRGQKFGGARDFGPGQYQSGPAPTAGGSDEVAQLKTDIANITGRLQKAGIAERKS